MSLLDTQTEAFCYMNKSYVPDGEGGVSMEWTNGAKFQATARLDSSIQAKIAEQIGVTSLYTIITNKNVKLEFHDVIKRISDGEIFRITSDGKDDKTPDTAGLNMRKASAEKWRLPT